MSDMPVRQFPGAVNAFQIFTILQSRKIFSLMRSKRNDVGCTVGQKNSGTAKSNFHHLPCKVANFVVHRLVSRNQITGCSVVIGSKMCTKATVPSGIRDFSGSHFTVGVKN